MKRQHLVIIALSALSLILAAAALAGPTQRLGAGIHYWRTVDTIDLKDVDESGFSWLITYQYAPAALIKVQTDLEMFPKRFGGTHEQVYSPQAFVLVGSSIYAGLGIGGYYNAGEWADGPFYALRAGVDLELLPSLYLDINANYRFEEWKGLSEIVKDIHTDTITLGAAVRLAF